MSLGNEYQLLSEVPPMQAVSSRKLKLFAFACQRLTFDAGQVLCRQGDVADGVFVIVDGEVDVSLEGSGGARHLRRMGRHAFIGEIASLANSTRTATVTATTPVTALKLDREHLHRLLRDEPPLKAAIERHIANAAYVFE